jgi:ATP-binding cassette subfamily A (ABC1) protein 3
MTGFNVASGLTFGFSFLIASFAVFLIKENSSNSKHLQYLSGCSSYIFWLSAFIWDMLSYLLVLIFVIGLLKLFGISEFVDEGRWVSVLALLVLYGLAHIPQMYLLSYLFQVSATGFAFLVGWNILSSQVTLTPVQILSLPQLQLVDVSEVLEWVFLVFFPNFCLGQSLIDLYENQQITGLCKDFVNSCAFIPNPCCLNFNTTRPNKCGVGSDCLRWSENIFSWEK